MVFVGAITTVLQHTGVIEFIVKKLAVIMQVTMTTTAVETIMAAMNIFLGFVSITRI